MKLITFDSSLQSVRSSNKPLISFSVKGIISINRTAFDAMGLKEGDKISLHQDSQNPEDWYLSKDVNGCSLRSLNGKKDRYGFNSVKIVKEFKECFDIPFDESCSMVIASEPIDEEIEINGTKQKLFAIFTSEHI